MNLILKFAQLRVIHNHAGNDGNLIIHNSKQERKGREADGLEQMQEATLEPYFASRSWLCHSWGSGVQRPCQRLVWNLRLLGEGSLFSRCPCCLSDKQYHHRIHHIKQCNYHTSSSSSHPNSKKYAFTPSPSYGSRSNWCTICFLASNGNSFKCCRVYNWTHWNERHDQDWIATQDCRNCYIDPFDAYTWWLIPFHSSAYCLIFLFD